jgi:hypothetical protein
MNLILRMEKFGSFTEMWQLFEIPGLAELGPVKRASALSISDIERTCKSFAKNQTTDLLRASALLWNDHLDEAHQIVQDLGNADASLLHAIMHRREPDFGNANYWFRKVGEHGCYPALASKAAAVLANLPELREFALISTGHWNPFEFVDACEAVSHKRLSVASVAALRTIQEAEIRSLISVITT